MLKPISRILSVIFNLESDFDNVSILIALCPYLICWRYSLRHNKTFQTSEKFVFHSPFVLYVLGGFKKIMPLENKTGYVIWIIR